MDSPAPTRRTLLRTAVWSVPVVVVCAAAPAYAASPAANPFTITVTLTAPNNRAQFNFSGGGPANGSLVTMQSAVRTRPSGVINNYVTFAPNPFLVDGFTLATANGSYVAGSSYVLTFTWGPTGTEFTSTATVVA